MGTSWCTGEILNKQNYHHRHEKPWRRVSKLQTDTGAGAAKRGLVAEGETVQGLSEPGAPAFTRRPPGWLGEHLCHESLNVRKRISFKDETFLMFDVFLEIEHNRQVGRADFFMKSFSFLRSWSAIKGLASFSFFREQNRFIGFGFDLAKR